MTNRLINIKPTFRARCPVCSFPMQEGTVQNGGEELTIWACDRHKDSMPMLERLPNSVAEQKLANAAARKLN